MIKIISQNENTELLIYEAKNTKEKRIIIQIVNKKTRGTQSISITPLTFNELIIEQQKLNAELKEKLK